MTLESMKSDSGQSPAAASPTRDLNVTRSVLAIGIPLVSMGALIAISITAISWATDKGGASQTVFNAVLPLIGTWVGTVMAYFFSRDNFESANKSVERLTTQLTTKEKLKSVAVMTVAVPLNKMVVCNVDPGTKKAQDAVNELDSRNLKRYPIIDAATGAVTALIERWDIQDHLYLTPEAARDAVTIKNVLDSPKNYRKLFFVVDQSATLADAQQALSSNPDARVVFVTKGGKVTDAVVGMLTTADVAREALA